MYFDNFSHLVALVIIGLIICVVAIYIWWKIAGEFFTIAVGKGYEERKYFWYCFLFSFVGYLLVIALPDKTKMNIENGASQVIDELPEI